jgi:hypothetical protein
MEKPAAPPLPRWVKGFSALAFGLFVVFVVLHVTGRSPHGHSGHLNTLPASTAASSP